MLNVIIGIGFDGADAPGRFRREVTQVIERLGKFSAVIDGLSYSHEWGEEDGAWLAAEFATMDKYLEARARILAVAATYNQEAVAFTIGTTEVASCPKTRPAYRDFL